MSYDAVSIAEALTAAAAATVAAAAPCRRCHPSKPIRSPWRHGMRDIVKGTSLPANSIEVNILSPWTGSYCCHCCCYRRRSVPPIPLIFMRAMAEGTTCLPTILMFLFSAVWPGAYCCHCSCCHCCAGAVLLPSLSDSCVPWLKTPGCPPTVLMLLFSALWLTSAHNSQSGILSENLGGC